MKTTTKLNIINLKANQVRTVVTIIGVALSCALIFTIICVIASFMFSIRYQAVQEYGDYHVMYENIPGDKLSLFENSKDYTVQ